MLNTRSKIACVFSIILVTMIVLLLPVQAKADGGLWVNPYLFAKLKEGQQIAVIRFLDINSASVDLFVSILDQTGESHEVVFFVPLGIKASNFTVSEKSSYAFNSSMTNAMDMVLFTTQRQVQGITHSLFAGALLTNGIWLIPLWLPLLLNGCGEPPAPVSTFKTDSSEVSVYSLEEDTDLGALINATGLAPAVLDTLSRLSGQQIAVVKLQTKPGSADTVIRGSSASAGEPGLHLSWKTFLNQSAKGATYAYPLGTGTAWAHPIEMTRVYITAPSNLKLSISYPRLGKNLSGFAKNSHSYEPRILHSGKQPAYAVEKAIYQNDYPYPGEGRIWRITYANSNAAEDISIAAKNSEENLFVAKLRSSVRRAGPSLAFITGLIAAALFWILTWIFLMPRLQGQGRRIDNLWVIPLTYIGWNLLLFIPGLILYLVYQFADEKVIALTILVFLFAGVSFLVFFFRHLDTLNMVRGKAVRNFIIVTAVSNGAYLLFALGYALLAGAI